MATTNLSTLSSDGLKGTPQGTGARYTSLAQFQARQTDCVANDVVEILECYDDWSGDGLNERLTLTGWNTDATRFITIRAAAGQGHDGTPNTGFRMWSASEDVLLIRQDYTVIEGFQVKVVSSTGAPHVIYIDAENCLVDRMIGIGDISVVTAGAAFNSWSDGVPANNLVVRNSYFEQIGTGGTSCFTMFGTVPVTGIEVQNCTIVGGANHGLSSSSNNTAIYTNVTAVGATNNDFSGTTNKTFINCASSDTTAIGTSPITGVSIADGVDFVSPSTDDYTPVHDGLLNGRGADLSGTFTDDITGATRQLPWEIGAYDIAQAPTPADSLSTLSSDGLKGTPTGNGARYTVMATWESSQQGKGGDLVTEGVKEILECYNDWTGDGISGALLIAGWITDASNYIEVRPADGQGHNGVRDAGFRMTAASTNALRIQQQYTRITGIQINSPGNETSSPFALEAASDGTVIDSVIVTMRGAGGASRSGIAGFGTVDITVRNSLIINDDDGGDQGIAVTPAAGSVHKLQNNTVVGPWNRGYIMGGSPATSEIQNCISHGATTDFDNQQTWGVSTNNASKDATAPGTSSVTGTLDADFVDYAGGNFTPAKSGQLDGVGVDLSVDFTDDITGFTRLDSWEIGAYEIQRAFDDTNAFTITIASASTGVDPNDLTSAQTLDNVDLALAFTVTADPVASGQTLDNVALSQEGQITPDALSQNQTLDNVDIAIAFTISTDGVASGQTLDNVDLVQSTALAVADLIQNQLIDNVDLIQAGSIAPDALANNQTLSNVTLSSAGVIAILDILQGQTIENVTVSPHYTVAPDGIDNFQLLSNVTLSPEDVVAIVDIDQFQSLTNVELTQAGTVQVNDLTQQNLIDVVRFGGLIIGALDGEVTIYPYLTGDPVMYH